MMNKRLVPPSLKIRPLRFDDLERVIAIDKAHTGGARRRFMEKRLAAAAAAPDDFVQVGVERAGTLAGFALGRVLYGEFGMVEPVAVLDAIGVDPASQERGCGHALMDGLQEQLRSRGVQALHSQAEWTSHGLLEFFDSTGFTLAPRVVLERSTMQSMSEQGEEI
jgi:ribosomal protein S18 acetylase RimI-like enzyme